ncbi:esterase family protein [Mucilaginibacter lappiensis]|uniref:Esterase/lipase superfamily enzyme n=1 Tax=Mucilaginibacter lappiensis TaxID=354630 RepID=A0A1N6NL58_9SPHI|nr:alpha/beta hydrolase-fold protein [Mucilaginibacter lappiensis]MBB6107910.1 esterase/lipase superfamily enzyme [Mucilaginibacter lappiensis]MBB6126020.1 esterase/lipase superfamily enzyme [Mucilaginibacter lappiensis]SIP92869.1 Esterase/lipase superfamily enzyme [Mucilaginibacter lappiensis]
MNREYTRWYSPVLQRNMEMLIFGYSGASVLFFPARMGRFYDYENWRVIESLRHKIENGYIQVYCVDSCDTESFYSSWFHPSVKILRHIQYEQYILEEVVPYIDIKNPNSFKIAAGCSLGAYHAVNISLRHPGIFNKVVGMSGRYDLATKIGHYEDLLEGYWDENVYFNMPLQYIPNLTDESKLEMLRQLCIVLAVGKEDVLLDNNYTLSHLLTEKGINNSLYLWDNEAHQARAWRQMVINYL